MRRKQEIRRIVEGFATSGMTRRQYCQGHGISITTLDYWRRKHNTKAGAPDNQFGVKLGDIRTLAKKLTARKSTAKKSKTDHQLAIEARALRMSR